MNRHDRVIRLIMCPVMCLLCGTAAAQTFAPPPIGLNLAENTYWNTNFAFSDAMQSGWGFYTTPGDIFNYGVTVPAGSNGYPAQDWASFNNLAAYPDGNYSLSYKGKGNVSFAWDGSIVPGSSTYNAATDTTTATVNILHNPNGGHYTLLRVTGVDATDPVRDMHLMVPSQYTSQYKSSEFTDQFLKRLQPFKGPIRFMDWNETNFNTTANWSDRAQPQGLLTGTHAGVPVETQIDLINATGKDAWVNIPYLASPDFVGQEAKLWASKLKVAPGQKVVVYTEWANEVWNGTFQVANWAYNTAQTYPGLTENGYGGEAQLIAQKTKEVGDAFKSAFAGNPNVEVRPILGVQSATDFWTNEGLKYLQQKYGNVSNSIYGTAGSMYGGTWLTSGTSDQLVAGAVTDSANAIGGWTTTQVGIAKQFGVHFLAYEGGENIPYSDANWVGMNNSPGQLQVIKSILNTWRQSNPGPTGAGEPYNWFVQTTTPTSYGAWGLLDSADAHGSAKWDSLMSILLAPGDANLDGKVDFSDFAILQADWGQSGWWEDGHWSTPGAPGPIGPADFALWESNASGLSADQWSQVDTFAAANGMNVPEPVGVTFILAAWCWVVGRRRRNA